MVWQDLVSKDWRKAMKEHEIENNRLISDKEFEDIKEHWIVVCGGRMRDPIMDSMQKRVLVWAAISFVIAVFYIALSLVTWKAISWIGS
jgi:hypothetical protein